MTEEIKTCDSKEKCLKKLKEFAFISGAVFVGATLAILLSAVILKPKCPPCPRGFMGPQPRMERPLPPPPPMMRDHGWGPQDFRGGKDRAPRIHHKDMGYRGPQGGPPPEFRGGLGPVKPDRKMLKKNLKNKPIPLEPKAPTPKA